MATYTELRGLFNDSELLGKIEVAAIIAANDLLSGTPTANDRAWAAGAFSSPKAESKKVLMSVLAENSGLAAASITSATDAAIQNNVNSVVPQLVLAKAGE